MKYLVIHFSVHLHQQSIAIRNEITTNIARNGHGHMFVAFDEEIVRHAYGVTGFPDPDGFEQTGVLELIEGQVGIELVGHLKK